MKSEEAPWEYWATIPLDGCAPLNRYWYDAYSYRCAPPLPVGYKELGGEVAFWVYAKERALGVGSSCG